MNKFFKAISIGMQVLSAVSDAVDPESEGGEKITTAEIVRIGIRTAFASAQVLKADISTDEDLDILQIVREELQMASMG